MNSSKVPISKYLFNIYTHCTIIRLYINTLSLYVWYKYSGRIPPYRYLFGLFTPFIVMN